MTAQSKDAGIQAIVRRAEERFAAHRHQISSATDRLFAALMGGQWIFGIVVALAGEPVSDVGDMQRIMVDELIGGRVDILLFREGRMLTLPIVPEELAAG